MGALGLGKKFHPAGFPGKSGGKPGLRGPPNQVRPTLSPGGLGSPPLGWGENCPPFKPKSLPPALFPKLKKTKKKFKNVFR